MESKISNSRLIESIIIQLFLIFLICAKIALIYPLNFLISSVQNYLIQISQSDKQYSPNECIDKFIIYFGSTSLLVGLKVFVEIFCTSDLKPLGPLVVYLSICVAIMEWVKNFKPSESVQDYNLLKNQATSLKQNKKVQNNKLLPNEKKNMRPDHFDDHTVWEKQPGNIQNDDTSNNQKKKNKQIEKVQEDNLLEKQKKSSKFPKMVKDNLLKNQNKNPKHRENVQEDNLLMIQKKGPNLLKMVPENNLLKIQKKSPKLPEIGQDNNLLKNQKKNLKTLKNAQSDHLLKIHKKTPELPKWFKKINCYKSKDES